MTRTTLARDLSYILETTISTRKDKALEVVNKVLDTIVKALRRGESVKIQGFGILCLATRPARRKHVHIEFGYLKGLNEIRLIPAKTYVLFKPSKVLLRMVNGEDNG